MDAKNNAGVACWHLARGRHVAMGGYDLLPLLLLQKSCLRSEVVVADQRDRCTWDVGGSSTPPKGRERTDVNIYRVQFRCYYVM